MTKNISNNLWRATNYLIREFCLTVFVYYCGDVPVVSGVVRRIARLKISIAYLN